MRVLTYVVMLSLGLWMFTGCGSSTDTVVVNEPTLPKLGDQTIKSDGSIDYIDYKGETRNAPASAAAAEYHAAKGYGNTLFDSAENKCQNCHNELYDTWDKSMHGQSWKDKVFQGKMQDFLRINIAKIGEDKTAVGGLEYTEAKFKGAAQTCIKCHAPGAYYGGDFQVDLSNKPKINSTWTRSC